MRRLLAVAAVTAAAFALPAPAAQAYSCGGVVDYDCTGWWCSLDCFGGECTLWLDPLHDPHSARCLG